MVIILFLKQQKQTGWPLSGESVDIMILYDNTSIVNSKQRIEPVTRIYPCHFVRVLSGDIEYVLSD